MINNSDIIKRIKEGSQVNIISHDEDFDDQTDDFIDRVSNAITKEHNIIPVICEDMFEYFNPQIGDTQTLHSYLVQRVLDDCRRPIDLTDSQLEEIIMDEYYGMRFLEDRTSNNRRNKSFHQILFSSINNNARLKNEVKEFLLACKFPLIITTSCYDILERELNGQYKSYYAKIDGSYDDKNDNSTKPKTVHSENLPSNCIYHIFGKANTIRPDWGYSDKQIIEYIGYAMGVGPWTNLTSKIKDASLLFIGNSTPNWLFRFILTPIYGDSVYKSARTGYYINSSSNLNDDHLIYFLKDVSISKDSNLRTILNKITHQVLDLMPQVNNNENKPKVFLSHASEDNPTVKKMVTSLLSRKNGLKVL